MRWQLQEIVSSTADQLNSPYLTPDDAWYTVSNAQAYEYIVDDDRNFLSGRFQTMSGVWVDLELGLVTGYRGIHACEEPITNPETLETLTQQLREVYEL